MKNELIWILDDSGIKLIVDNCRNREEAHVYIEHLVDESVGLIENVDAEKTTSEAVLTVEKHIRLHVMKAQVDNRKWMQLKMLRRPFLKQLNQLKRK